MFGGKMRPYWGSVPRWGILPSKDTLCQVGCQLQLVGIVECKTELAKSQRTRANKLTVLVGNWRVG